MNLKKQYWHFNNLDAVVICGFGIIFSASLLNKRKAYNFHPGTLPDYKGRHPTFFATVAGEKTIGMTLHEVSPEIDAGKILAIEKIFYGFKENENDLFLKYPYAVRALLPTLISALNGAELGIQNQGGSYYKPVSEMDKTFTVNDSPGRILNILRAQARYGGRYLFTSR
jgi:methionyl-tRNA formyltransferase